MYLTMQTGHIKPLEKKCTVQGLKFIQWCWR